MGSSAAPPRDLRAAATSTSPEIGLQTAWAAADVQATQGGATIRGTVYAGINLRVSQLEVTLADGEVLELTRVVPTNTGAGAACALGAGAPLNQCGSW